MITATEKRPTAAELMQKHRQDVLAKYTELLEDIDRRRGSEMTELKQMDILGAKENLTFNYFCLPYYGEYLAWKCKNFPYANAEFSKVTSFDLDDHIIFTYIFSVFGQGIAPKLMEIYGEHPEQAEKPLTDGETEFFKSYLEDVVNPSLTELIENIRAGKYRTLNEIDEEIAAAFKNVKFREIITSQEQWNRYNSFLQEQCKPRNDLAEIIVKYAELCGISAKLRKLHTKIEPENKPKPKSKKKQSDAVVTPFEISPYSLVLSNQFARSAMLMNTSRPLEKESLLDSSVQVFAPKLREEGIDGITQIAIDTEHLGDITATWGTAEKRLFAMYNEAICKGGAETREIVININDYMKRCNLSVSNKKETVKELKKAIDRMFYTSVRFEDDKGSKANFALFETTAYHNGNIFIKGTDRLVTAMTGGKGGRNVMHLPAEYYTCKGKNAVSAMNVIQALCYHQGNYNNVIRSMKYENRQNEHYKISSLLRKTEIATIEKVRETQQSWKSKIKEPLESILNDFLGVKNWEYIINDKLVYSDELPPGITYEEWEDLTIRYNIENFPNEQVIQGIETKKAKKEEARQILADKAAVARERERKSNKKKAAASNS